MSSSIRFLGFTILAWTAARTVSVALLPETGVLRFEAAAATPGKPLPSIVPTPLPPIEPLPQPASTLPSALYPLAYVPYPAYLPYPVAGSVTAPAAGSSSPHYVYDEPQAAAYAFQPPVPATSNSGDVAKLGDVSTKQTTPPLFDRPAAAPALDRVSVSSWAMVRNQRGPDSLGGSGVLGGSEAGARLLWRFTPALSASARTSAPVNDGRGMEVAAGLRYQPFDAWPIAFTVERRQGIRDYGRNAFAFYVESGVYDRPMPWRFNLDGYFQTGIVDLKDPDWFVDGQTTLTRPLWRNMSGGFGIWGGAQPGLARLDAGPRASLRFGSRMRAHLDYRVNLAGNAQPGSGAVMTLAGDF